MEWQFKVNFAQYTFGCFTGMFFSKLHCRLEAYGWSSAVRSYTNLCNKAGRRGNDIHVCFPNANISCVMHFRGTYTYPMTGLVWNNCDVVQWTLLVIIIHVISDWLQLIRVYYSIASLATGREHWVCDSSKVKLFHNYYWIHSKCTLSYIILTHGLRNSRSWCQ